MRVKDEKIEVIMKKITKSFSAIFLACVLMMALSVSAFAVDVAPRAYQSATDTISFKNVDRMSENEKIEYTVINADGNSATIGIRALSSITRADSRTFEVYYDSLAVRCKFYMTVSNNKVIDAYDENITTLAGTYDDAKFVKTSTYAKLSFKYTTVGGWSSNTCWLKGTVTGSDNDIDVTWDM